MKVYMLVVALRYMLVVTLLISVMQVEGVYQGTISKHSNSPAIHEAMVKVCIYSSYTLVFTIRSDLKCGHEKLIIFI